MPESARYIYFRVITRTQAPVYSTHSVESLRRDRRTGPGPIFVRIRRSVHRPNPESGTFIPPESSLVALGVTRA
jgi:hypothetical protein